MDRSYPRWQVKAALIYGNTLETWDKASHWTRNPETNRAEYLCSPCVPAALHPTYNTQARRFPDWLHRACIASASPPGSRHSFESPRGFLLSAPPNISELVPTRRRAPLRRHCRSAKRSPSLVRGEPSPDETPLELRSRRHKSHSGEGRAHL